MKKNLHDFNRITGKFIDLREVNVKDAQFIIDLRTSEKGSRFLHKTEIDVSRQEAYLMNYLSKDDEWYFVVEDKTGRRVGCLGLYDAQKGSIRKGRWVMQEGVDSRFGIEADYLARRFAFEDLGVEVVKSDAMIANVKNHVYHKVWGCVEEGRDDERIFYSLVKSVYLTNAKNIRRYFDQDGSFVEDASNTFGKSVRVVPIRDYKQVFIETLEADPAAVETFTYGVDVNWDSVGHVGLIEALENTFDVKFSPEEITKLKSYEVGLRMMKSKGISFV